MHLGNSIICPVTGSIMLVSMGLCAGFAFKNAKIKKENILPFISLTGLIFTLQMINFSIPATGSSGHIIGALLLSALFGPSLAFLAISGILLIQALLFADGGLLALGCNIFNMGFLACFIAYPLIFKPLNKLGKPLAAALLASIAALQLGSIGVVLESLVSGSILNNTGLFTGLMQSIHLPIGIIEGLFTAAILTITDKEGFSKRFSYSILAISVIIAGIVYKIASNKPDGLEWSLLNLSDSIVYQTQGVIYSFFENMQAKTTVLANITPFSNILGLFAVISLSCITARVSNLRKESV